MTGEVISPSDVNAYLMRQPAVIRPDSLCHEKLREAGGLRGRVVRAFFWLLRIWPPRQLKE